MNKEIVIVRAFKNIGIDAFLRGYNLTDGSTVERKVYNGRLCYIEGSNRIGISTLRKHRCRIILKEFKPPF